MTGRPRAAVAILTALGVGLVTLSGGCGDGCEGPVCVDGVLIRVLDPLGTPSTQFEGTVRASGATLEFGCAGVGTTRGDRINFQCLDDGQVLIFAPTDIRELEVSLNNTGGDAYDETVPLLYEPVFSHGPECPAVCEQARIEARLIAQ